MTVKLWDFQGYECVKTMHGLLLFIVCKTIILYCSLVHAASQHWCLLMMHRLQSVQNAAARLVSDMQHCDHISPTLRQFHWLPVRQRVLFQIAVLVFQCLTVQSPSYLADDCQLVSDVRPRRLRSSDSLTCVVWHTRNTRDQCFAAAGPLVWNSLSAELWRCHSLEQFRQCLKTLFFPSMGPRRFVTVSKTAPHRNSLTYLLRAQYLISG